MTEGRARLRGLYAVTPEGLDTPTLLARVGLCLAGGATIVQYRAKSVPPALAPAPLRIGIESWHRSGGTMPKRCNFTTVRPKLR